MKIKLTIILFLLFTLLNISNMNQTTKTVTVTDINSNSVGYIIGSKGANIKKIINEVGKGCKVTYVSTKNTFEIKARTIEICYKAKDHLYEAEREWKNTRREYLAKRNMENEKRKEEKNTRNTEYIKANPIKLDFIGSIKDKKKGRWELLNNIPNKVVDSKELKKPTFTMSKTNFPTVGTSEKKADTSVWNCKLSKVKSQESFVTPQKPKPKSQKQKTFAPVKDSKKGNVYRLAESEMDDFKRYISNSDSGVYA